MFICAGDDVPSSHGARHYGVPHIDQFPCGRGPAEFPREETADSKIVGGFTGKLSGSLPCYSINIRTFP